MYIYRNDCITNTSHSNIRKTNFTITSTWWSDYLLSIFFFLVGFFLFFFNFCCCCCCTSHSCSPERTDILFSIWLHGHFDFPVTSASVAFPFYLRSTDSIPKVEQYFGSENPINFMVNTNLNDRIGQQADRKLTNKKNNRTTTTGKWQLNSHTPWMRAGYSGILHGNDNECNQPSKKWLANHSKEKRLPGKR